MDTTQLDPRLGLPSASSMHRAASCPGSVALEAQCPPDQPNKWSERGSRIAAYRAGEPVKLTPEELETSAQCDRLLLRVLSEWAGIMPAEVINRERRLWFFRDAEPVFSGVPDTVYQQGNRALILDDKSGWAELDPPAINMQLRTLAVLVAEDAAGEIDEISVGLVAPKVSGKVDLVVYNADDLLTAREEILGICEKTRDPNAPRIPGESQCKHCRGKLRCPELKAQLTMAAEPKFHPGVLLDKDLAQLLDIASAAKHMIAAAENEAKRRLAENPESVPGWMLKEGAKVRHVEDPEAVYNALEGHVNHEGFLSCVEVKIGALEKLVVENTADCFPTKKAARENFQACVAPYITLTQNAPSLKRVKALPE